jgi:hypothetical protein
LRIRRNAWRDSADPSNSPDSERNPSKGPSVLGEDLLEGVGDLVCGVAFQGRRRDRGQLPATGTALDELLRDPLAG